MSDHHFTFTVAPYLKTREQVKVEVFLAVSAEFPPGMKEERLRTELEAIVDNCASLWALRFSDAEETLNDYAYQDLYTMIEEAIRKGR